MAIRHFVLPTLLVLMADTAIAEGSARARIAIAGVQGDRQDAEARCLDEQNLLTAQQVIDAFGTSVDQHIGFGVAGTSLGVFSRSVRDELAPLMRTRKGAATCAPLCVVVPAERAIDWKFCVQNGGGEQCRLSNGGFGDLNASVRGYSTAFSSSGLAQVICGTVKNWDQGGSRTFNLRALY